VILALSDTLPKDLYVWGLNEQSQLGLDDDDIKVEVPVAEPRILKDFTKKTLQVSAGTVTTLALRKDSVTTYAVQIGSTFLACEEEGKPPADPAKNIYREGDTEAYQIIASIPFEVDF